MNELVVPFWRSRLGFTVASLVMLPDFIDSFVPTKQVFAILLRHLVSIFNSDFNVQCFSLEFSNVITLLQIDSFKTRINLYLNLAFEFTFVAQYRRIVYICVQ